MGAGVICMPPMYINIGAYVGDGSLIDSHALVGSCAQVGQRVHVSAAAQIGGVLEPVGALPVIVEDDVLVRVRDGGDRIEVKAELLDAKKQVLASRKTKAGRADLNDITGFTCNPNTPLWLRLIQGDKVKQIPLRLSLIHI